jgi:hypothetical protein
MHDAPVSSALPEYPHPVVSTIFPNRAPVT